jgi:hypothetical protein
MVTLAKLDYRLLKRQDLRVSLSLEETRFKKSIFLNNFKTMLFGNISSKNTLLSKNGAIL